MSIASRQWLLRICATALALLLFATGALAQSGPTVVISDGLEPALIQVATGTTVTCRNDDDERHRMRSREGPVEFDSGDLEPGESYSFTFVVEGSYPYLDHRNDEDAAWSGSVVVGGAASAGPVDGPVESTGSLPTYADVSIADRAFSPASVSVGLGATVEWTNSDDEEHTVTFREGAPPGDFLDVGATYSQAFDAPGTFAYFCAIHTEMTGTVTVSDAGAVLGAPLPSPGAPLPSPGAPLPSQGVTAAPGSSPSPSA